MRQQLSMLTMLLAIMCQLSIWALSLHGLVKKPFQNEFSFPEKNLKRASFAQPIKRNDNNRFKYGLKKRNCVLYGTGDARKAYYFEPGPVPFDIASLQCKHYGMELTIILDVTHNNWLVDQAQNFFSVDGAWIGYTDARSPNNFKWLSDSLRSRTPIEEAQWYFPPKARKYQDGSLCALLMLSGSPQSYKWSDMDCRNYKAFICESSTIYCNRRRDINMAIRERAQSDNPLVNLQQVDQGSVIDCAPENSTYMKFIDHMSFTVDCVLFPKQHMEICRRNCRQTIFGVRWTIPCKINCTATLKISYKNDDGYEFVITNKIDFIINVRYPGQKGFILADDQTEFRKIPTVNDIENDVSRLICEFSYQDSLTIYTKRELNVSYSCPNNETGSEKGKTEASISISSCGPVGTFRIECIELYENQRSSYLVRKTDEVTVEASFTPDSDDQIEIGSHLTCRVTKGIQYVNEWQVVLLCPNGNNREIPTRTAECAANSHSGNCYLSAKGVVSDIECEITCKALIKPEYLGYVGEELTVVNNTYENVLTNSDSPRMDMVFKNQNVTNRQAITSNNPYILCDLYLKKLPISSNIFIEMWVSISCGTSKKNICPETIKCGIALSTCIGDTRVTCNDGYSRAVNTKNVIVKHKIVLEPTRPDSRKAIKMNDKLSIGWPIKCDLDGTLLYLRSATLEIECPDTKIPNKRKTCPANDLDQCIIVLEGFISPINCTFVCSGVLAMSHRYLSMKKNVKVTAEVLSFQTLEWVVFGSNNNKLENNSKIDRDENNFTCAVIAPAQLPQDMHISMKIDMNCTFGDYQIKSCPDQHSCDTVTHSCGNLTLIHITCEDLYSKESKDFYFYKFREIQATLKRLDSSRNKVPIVEDDEVFISSPPVYCFYEVEYETDAMYIEGALIDQINCQKLGTILEGSTNCTFWAFSQNRRQPDCEYKVRGIVTHIQCQLSCRIYLNGNYSIHLGELVNVHNVTRTVTIKMKESLTMIAKGLEYEGSPSMELADGQIIDTDVKIVTCYMDFYPFQAAELFMSLEVKKTCLFGSDDKTSCAIGNPFLCSITIGDCGDLTEITITFTEIFSGNNRQWIFKKTVEIELMIPLNGNGLVRVGETVSCIISHGKKSIVKYLWFQQEIGGLKIPSPPAIPFSKTCFMNSTAKNCELKIIGLIETNDNNILTCNATIHDIYQQYKNHLFTVRNTYQTATVNVLKRDIYLYGDGAMLDKSVQSQKVDTLLKVVECRIEPGRKEIPEMRSSLKISMDCGSGVVTSICPDVNECKTDIVSCGELAKIIFSCQEEYTGIKQTWILFKQDFIGAEIYKMNAKIKLRNNDKTTGSGDILVCRLSNGDAKNVKELTFVQICGTNTLSSTICPGTTLKTKECSLTLNYSNIECTISCSVTAFSSFIITEGQSINITLLINGGWSEWGNWTYCTKTCGVGRKMRFRDCTEPPPSKGGQQCPGRSEQRWKCSIVSQCPSADERREETLEGKENNDDIVQNVLIAFACILGLVGLCICFLFLIRRRRKRRTDFDLYQSSSSTKDEEAAKKPI